MRTKANPHEISDQDLVDIGSVLNDAMGLYAEYYKECPDHAVRVAIMISNLETQAKAVTKESTPTGVRIFAKLGKAEPVGHGITQDQIKKATLPKPAEDPFAFSTHLQNLMRSGKFGNFDDFND